jgi:hypothetical protein
VELLAAWLMAPDQAQTSFAALLIAAFWQVKQLRGQN